MKDGFTYKMNFSRTDEIINVLTEENIIPAVSVAVGLGGKIVYERAAGTILESGHVVTEDSRFDIASLTKIFTGICFMQMLEEGRFSLDQPICEFFPQMAGLRPIEKNGKVIGHADASKITWWNVLTHTTGMGWTREKTRPSLPGVDKDLSVIFDLPFAYNVNEHVIYSDIPIILMGKAMEIVEKKPVDEIVDNRLIHRLRLRNTGYRRLSQYSMLADSQKTIPPTEYDDVFRKKRVWGEVHDENAWTMDGVSAHAGIFSTASDVCEVMMEFNRAREEGGILASKTAKEMSSLQTEEDGDRRGLIWHLSSNAENAYTQILSECSYGHEGFTGCFAWNDPDRNISIVFLSNDIYNGRDNRVLPKYRKQIMETIILKNC